ncbi:DNA mismatch endonuclease Vsr [Roseibium sp. FZY0029]|uniref:very short patch repair endonuclease n=1 Tax=Roseibium sp. FZY0029 TaxID=3116647 RepID=UPI002E9B1622|nr:DNA mismatch endonuclease Vsr [Roseibium sp. FZY0029]
MADRLTKDARSNLMGRVKAKDTGPEMIVRRIVHRLGYRYRLHRRDLPGTPDMVFPRLHKVIFVHGCFWHRHGCSRTTTPKTKTDFWKAKFEANVKRDNRQLAELTKLGWENLIIWECETKNIDQLTSVLRDYLKPSE